MRWKLRRDRTRATFKLGHVNLVLFEAAETTRPLPRADPRAIHILDVLRRRVGDRLEVGVVDGPRGDATVTAIGPAAIELEYIWSTEPPPLPEITLLVGVPRPQTARKILQEATTLGVREIHFVLTERGEPNYIRSTLWQTGEWRRHVVAGAAQACDTRLPNVSFNATLSEQLGRLPAGGTRFALDNYEAAEHLAVAPWLGLPATIALGAERGWSAAERSTLRDQQFILVHLGTRVLRTETACVAALALLQARASPAVSSVSR